MTLASLRVGDASDADLLAELRSRGLVIIVWSPEDVGELDSRLSRAEAEAILRQAASNLEDRSVERGWDVLEHHLLLAQVS